MRKFIFILFSCLAAQLCRAQMDCSFTHYSSEDGLSQNTVMSILQDSKGTMWFASWDGINKFNGYTFRSYKARLGDHLNLTNNRVDHMYEDKYGFIWVLTYDNRAHRFDPRREEFEQVPASGEASGYYINSITVLPGGVVWLLAENEGAIRVTTDENTFELATEIYSEKSGLFPSSHFNRVVEDSEGNEWMLTGNGIGLIRKGEVEPASYFVEARDANVNQDHSFYSILEHGDRFYFGSAKGRVWQYLKKENRFELLELDTKSPVIAINRVADDLLVITTDRDGFFTYHLNGKTDHYSPAKYPDIPSVIRSVYVDRGSEVWFEQSEVPGSVTHFNPFKKILKREQLTVEARSASRSHPAFHIHEDINGFTWVHPYSGGFSYFDREKNCLVPFYNEPESKNWRFSNKIHSAFSDRQGNLWVCTHSKGIEKVTFRSAFFNFTMPVPHEYESLSNEVRSVCQDNDGKIWMGMKDELIRIYDEEFNYLGYLTAAGQIAKSGTPLSGVAYSIRQDSEGYIWIATKGEGLVRAEKKADGGYSFIRLKYNEDDVYSLSSDDIYSTYEDSKGRIWLATFGGGVNYLEKDRNGEYVFISHRNNLKGYPIDKCYRVRYITGDKEGRIWIGTTTGALSFSENFDRPEDIQFNHYSRIPNDLASLSSNDVHWITVTRKGEIYLATFGGGLDKIVSIDPDGGNARFESYNVRDGLSSDVLLSMQEDSHGNLWLSTENGVSKFNPQTGEFENYDEKSFALTFRFNEATSEYTSGNEMIFGTNNGFLYFNPDSIRKDDYVPPILFARLTVSGKEIRPGATKILKTNLDDASRLVLSHKENIFSFQFAALDYKNPNRIQYAYKLDGLEKDWVYVDKLRNATYTNLPKGNYVFKVRSTNSDGIWVDNERHLNITVLPSFWETPWAMLLYILGVMLIIFIAVYILFTIYRLKNEVVVEQKISDIKLRFFTNISHELRTPLTLIAGPVEYVLKNTQLPDNAREQLTVVEKNTERMLRLVNQILDFRKIQNKKMKMKVQELDVVIFVRRIMDNFESLAEDHHIDFILDSEQSNLKLWVDADKLEKIVFNLLSNAFKYTPQGKIIRVFIEENEETIAIGVQDQGIGIAENKKSSIFVRFENLMDKNVFNQSSTGIGLSLVKELVEMHSATIRVDSKLGEGSCFNVQFLKGKEHYDDTVEFIVSDSGEPMPTEKVTEAIIPLLSSEEIQPVPEDDDSPKETMLLVEDNAELRFFLKSIFSSTFRVVEARDGLDGSDKAMKLIPDIIISDVMMPEKDGIELTKELKTNITTSHIPVVLLTAKSAIDSKLEGLGIGADDYITKPFSATYLKARVDNLLAQRKKLRDLYRENLMEVPKEEPAEQQQHQPDISPYDKKFMDKLVDVMERNMDNGELVVDDLVQELAVSRSVFFKKLKMITGLAPIEFIKEMRIKRAAQLIETGEFNMTQIAYMVGINDPRYFSKCFKQKYNMTPTEYKEQLGKK